MKLEYLADGSDDFPLIRIFDFSTREAADLLAAVRQLVQTPGKAIPVDEMANVESIGGITLALVSGKRNRGIADTPPSFVCELTSLWWSNVEGLLEPFAASPSTGCYQWLDESGEVALLISPQGTW